MFVTKAGGAGRWEGRGGRWEEDEADEEAVEAGGIGGSDILNEEF